MGRDLLYSPYGRFYNLAYYLSTQGHCVELILFSYQLNEHESIKKGNLTVRSVSLLANPFGALYRVYNEIKTSPPDWIMGCSDTYYGIFAEFIAQRLSAKYKTKCLIDAGDNYESFLPYAKPLHWLWRRALKNADRVTCAGASLESLFKQYRAKEWNSPSYIFPMTADAPFFEQPRKTCRKKLGLPMDVKLVGYPGAISKTRDIETLFSAAKQIISKDQRDIKLVLTGRKDADIQIPDHVLYLGYLANEDMPLFINSLDVLVVMNKPSSFGDYSYTTKLYEAFACNIPVVVSSTKSTQWIMRRYPQLLVPPQNASALAEKIETLIDADRIKYEAIPSWKMLVEELAEEIFGA